jgi:hypothetical protein
MQWFEDKLGPEEKTRQPDDQPGATKTNGEGFTGTISATAERDADIARPIGPTSSGAPLC